MNDYKITAYSRKKAKELNVIIKKSIKGQYKIDVFDKEGNYLTSIGNKNYFDFPTYLKEKGKEYAQNRRRLYHIRHAKDIAKEGSRGWWSSVILW